MMLLLPLLASCVAGIEIRILKENILIPNNTNYDYTLNMTETNSNVDPFSNITLRHIITNSITTTAQYFDYFPRMSLADLACYQTAVGNMSYLFPCSFLLNSLANIRVTQGNDTETFKSYGNINYNNYHFVVDNTPYPFPEGAYPYSDITISSSTYLQVFVDQNYKQLGIMLIFINLTILLVYAALILGFLCKISRFRAHMKDRGYDNPETKNRASEFSREIDEESDADNYEQIMHNEFSMRDSKDERIPSLISSANSPNFTSNQPT